MKSRVCHRHLMIIPLIVLQQNNDAIDMHLKKSYAYAIDIYESIVYVWFP